MAQEKTLRLYVPQWQVEASRNTTSARNFYGGFFQRGPDDPALSIEDGSSEPGLGLDLLARSIFGQATTQFERE